MKRLILTAIVCFILCLSISVNSLASVGGALGGIGSGIDPRTDGRYKDNFELDINEENEKYFIDNNAASGDVVFTYNQDVSTPDGYKTVALKCYLRVWFIPSDFNNPCIFLRKGSNGSGNLIIRFLQSGELKSMAYTFASENYDGTFNFDGYAYVDSTRGTGCFDYDVQMGEIISSDFPVFSNLTDCDYYCSTGQVRNALYDPSPKDYSSELYFKSFDVIPHVSNSAKYYYFDIRYELSDYAKKNIDKLNLNFENMYRWESSNIFQSIDKIKQVSWRSNSISLKDNPYGFSIDMVDLGCIVVAHDQWGLSYDKIVGTSKFWNLTDTALGALISAELGADVDISVVSVTGAYLYFKFNLRFSGNNGVVVGKRNDFTYDILNNTVEKYIYTPDTSKDSSGNTTFNKDSNGNITYTQEGDKVTSNDYYYNKVTETSDGDTTNVTNNYYYYDKDGKQQEISEDEYNNSSMTVMGGEGGNASAEGGSAIANAAATIGDIIINIPPSSGLGGGSSGDNITINDDDLTKDGLANSIKYGFNIFDDMDTGEKGDGILALLTDLYAYLPDDFGRMPAFGVACTVGVSIILLILGRRR